MGAGITKVHNAAADPRNAWDYVVPISLGAIVGLIVDVVIVVPWIKSQTLHHGW